MGSIMNFKSFQLVDSWVFSVNTTNIDFDNLGGYSELMILCNGIAKAVSGEIGLQVSVDNGISFFAGVSYELISNAGVVTTTSLIGLHNTNATAARSAMVQIIGSNINGISKPILRPTRSGDGESCRFTGSLLPINAIRITTNNGGNITAGNIQILGR